MADGRSRMKMSVRVLRYVDWTLAATERVIRRVRRRVIRRKMVAAHGRPPYADEHLARLWRTVESGELPAWPGDLQERMRRLRSRSGAAHG